MTATVTGSAPWGDPRSFVDFIFSDFDIQSGMLVTVTDGTTIKRHIVTKLAFDVMSKTDDTVSGFAALDSDVYIWACDFNNNCFNRHITADTHTADPVIGAWLADWSKKGTQSDEQDIFDLVAGTWVDSSQSDEDGDHTMFGKNIPYPPNFAARFPEKEVHGYSWPLGSDVTISIDDPDFGTAVDYTATLHPIVAPWNSNETLVKFTLDGFELQPGQIITMRGLVEGELLTKVHSVSSLAVAEINLTTDTITGTVESGGRVELDANCGNKGCAAFRRETATGVNWSANFAIQGDDNDEKNITDLVPGSSGEVRTPDADGDNTTVQWSVPNPTFDAMYLEGNINAYGWRRCDHKNSSIGRE